jgi:cardiolipin synthase
MDALLSAATDLVALLPPARIGAIAERVRKAESADRATDLQHLTSTPASRAIFDRLLDAWEETAISGEAVAGILIGAAHARQSAQSESTVELVLTGPTTAFVPTRRTEQVLLDLIRHAERELFLVSFVAYNVPSVIYHLNAAVSRGVEVRVLLEAGVAYGGSLQVDSVPLIKARVPAAQTYVWVDRPDSYVSGRVHAKVVVADGRAAFLTSANLTAHALTMNMEAGVVIRGGSIPANLRSHFHALIGTGVIQLAT